MTTTTHVFEQPTKPILVMAPMTTDVPPSETVKVNLERHQIVGACPAEHNQRTRLWLWHGRVNIHGTEYFVDGLSSSNRQEPTYWYLAE